MTKDSFPDNVIQFSICHRDVLDVALALVEGAEKGEIDAISVVTKDCDGKRYYYWAGNATLGEHSHNADKLHLYLGELEDEDEIE